MNQIVLLHLMYDKEMLPYHEIQDMKPNHLHVFIAW